MTTCLDPDLTDETTSKSDASKPKSLTDAYSLPSSCDAISDTSVLRRDSVRNKNARFEIPVERNLRTLDHLISQSTDELEIKELKQQKRLLRNRQAALDSRQRKKQQTERLEEEKKHYAAVIGDLEEALQDQKIQEAEFQRQKEQWLGTQQQYQTYIEHLRMEKDELLRRHTIESGELRKRNAILMEQMHRMENTTMSTAPSSSDYLDSFVSSTTEWSQQSWLEQGVTGNTKDVGEAIDILQCPFCASENPWQRLYVLRDRFDEHVLEKHRSQGSSAQAEDGVQVKEEMKFTGLGFQLIRDSPPIPRMDNEFWRSSFRSVNDASQTTGNLQYSDKTTQTDNITILEANTTRKSMEEVDASTPSTFFTSTNVSTSESSRDDASSTSSPGSEHSSNTTVTDFDKNTQTLVAPLAKRIAQRCAELNRCQLRSRPGCHSAPSNSQITNSIRGAEESSQPKSRKRRRKNEDEDEDSSAEKEGDDEPPTKKRNRRILGKKLVWACPYTKHDPVRYSEHNRQGEKKYRKCPSAMLTNISRVKQHLQRTHLEPKYFCGNCYECFQTKQARLQHDKTDCAETSPRYQEMMTEEQYSLIPKHLPNDPSSWFRIFDILFDGATRPESPYVTADPSKLKHFIDLFRLVGPSEFITFFRTCSDPDSLALKRNVSLLTLINEAYEAAFPEYLESIQSATSGTSSQEESIVTLNEQTPLDLVPESQVSHFPIGNEAIDHQPFDNTKYGEAPFWINQPEVINNAFVSFTNDRSSELNSFLGFDTQDASVAWNIDDQLNG